MTLNSASTFDPPLMDGSLDVLQIIEHNAQNNAQHPLFRYTRGNGAIETTTWGSASKAFDVATRFVLESASFKAADGHGVPRVIGILANLDSITYYALVVGIMKAGFTVFPISTRNSADGVAHLLAKTSSKLLFTSNDATVARLAEASCSIFESANEGNHIPTVVVPPFDYFYNASPQAVGSIPIPSRVISDPSTTPCVIIHSSGTVSFPKPIYLTYQMFFEHGNQVGLEGDLCGHIISTHGMPMYHLMGLKVIVYTAFLGVTLAVFRPSTPPTIPTPDAVLNAAVATASSRIFCAPSFLESWAKQKSSVEALKGFTAIMFGGGPVQVSVGDYLAKEGVTLVPMVGMTEVGTITSFFPKHTRSEGWEWLALDPNFDFKFIREEGPTEIYRFIVKQNTFKTPAVVNTTADGIPAYDTGDLFIRHPTNPQLWKIYGRADEQIMHSSGEKTNPVPIEAGLTSSPYISGVVMFGRARFQTGVLIAPSSDYEFDVADVGKTKEYINLIWDTVEGVNRRSPQHSRIFKEMILIASPNKQFEYTSKGTLRRQITLAKYEQEINHLYAATESSHSAIAVPADTSHDKVPELEDFLPPVRTAVRTILGDAVADDDDLFRAGADSLCALSIRNAMISGLRASGALSARAIDALPENLLYYLPSISRIAAFLYGVAYIDSTNRNDQATTAMTTGQGEVGTEMESDSKPKVMSDEEWQKVLESEETVVEIVKGNGEPPLIILHGSPGTVGPFRSMLKSPTAIWAVQMSDDAPTDTAEALVAFYHRKIKAKQPHGPYRLASFSGSCALLLELVTTFERAGDRIAQFAMLDHFPTLFLSRIDLGAVDLADTAWWGPVLEKSFKGILRLFETTQGVMAAQSRVRIQELQDALDGQPGTSAMTAKIIGRTTALIRTTLAFLLGPRFSVADPEAGGRMRFSPELFKAYTAAIQAPLTVYVAKGGIRAIIPADKCADFGAREYFPDAKFKEFEGGHIDFLGNEKLLESLKMDYEGALYMPYFLVV